MEMHTFVSVEDFKLYATHPGNDTKGWKEKTFKCHFRNSVFQTKEPQCAEAIEAHIHFGRRFFNKPVSVGEVENKYLPEKQTLSDALSGMKITILRSIAKDQELTTWDRLKNMKKEQLVEFMVEHKDKLGHYGSLGN